MIEIKYRGKSLISGEWIYGYYYNMDDNRKGNRRHIIVYEPKSTGLQTIHEPVDPKTVGQYTGLKDINEVEIYKGDILLEDLGEDELIYKYVVTWDEENACFKGTLKPYEIEAKWFKLIEKIGNIYDNPGLLEV